MVTHNEGADLDPALHALGAAMTPADRLIVFDTGSTDRTVARLRAFGAPCHLVQLEVDVLDWGDAMRLALDLAKTPYLMAIGCRDRLCPDPLAELQGRLAAETPDLAVLETGWWLCYPDHPFPRTDATRSETLNATPKAEALQRLCPDPRRLVLSREVWQAQGAILAAPGSEGTLYATLLARAGTAIFQPGPVLLHQPAPLDSVAVLRDVGREIANLSAAARAARLDARLVWLDEAVLRAPPETGPALMAALSVLVRGLARPLRRHLREAEGPCGQLARAEHRGGRAEALATLALLAAHEDRTRTERLTADYARMRRDFDLALPGPDYLRALYERIRGL